MILFATLPDHRHFLPIFPVIAVLIARTFGRFSQHTERAVLLSFLFWVSNVYMFLDEGGNLTCSCRISRFGRGNAP